MISEAEFDLFQRLLRRHACTQVLPLRDEIQDEVQPEREQGRHHQEYHSQRLVLIVEKQGAQERHDQTGVHHGRCALHQLQRVQPHRAALSGLRQCAGKQAIQQITERAHHDNQGDKKYLCQHVDNRLWQKGFRRTVRSIDYWHGNHLFLRGYGTTSRARDTCRYGCPPSLCRRR